MEELAAVAGSALKIEEFGDNFPQYSLSLEL